VSLLCGGVTVNVHPDMKTVVVMELERLLYRPRVAAKAQLVLYTVTSDTQHL